MSRAAVSSRASSRATRLLGVALVGALVLSGVAVVTLSLSGGGVTGVGALASPTLARAEAPARISLFGDSLAHEAKAAFTAQLARRQARTSTVGTYPTTALCDFRRAINADLLQRRPGVLVLEFSGNSATPCMRDDTGTLPAPGSPPWRAQYLNDLRGVLAIARVTDTTVIWATAPPLSPALFPSNYPRQLAAAVRQLAVTNAGLHVVDSGAALTVDGRTYSRALPCRPDERAFCAGGRLDVRAADGLHFDCHGWPDALGACQGYSAGARRFGEAIADAAISRR